MKARTRRRTTASLSSRACRSARNPVARLNHARDPMARLNHARDPMARLYRAFTTLPRHNHTMSDRTVVLGLEP